MRKIENLAASTQQQIITLANDLNFQGKRLKSTKLIVVDSILETLELKGVCEAVALFDWLIAQKPEKAVEKVKAESEKIEPVFGAQLERDNNLKVLPAGQYIITSAQNNTKPAPAFKLIASLANQLSATLLIMPMFYNRVLDQDQRSCPTFHKDLENFMIFDNVWIGKKFGVRLAVGAGIIPTAKRPINTANTLNNGESVTIVASPKAQIQTLPRPKKGGSHRWAYTTRTITERHYTHSRAGDEAAQTHTFGGVLINVSDTGLISHNEIVINDQGTQAHIDGLTFELDQDGKIVMVDITPEAIVLGDLHCEKMCFYSLARSIEQIELSRSPVVILHDTLDQMSRNHHNIGSGKFLYQMGSRTVIDDLTETINVINKIAEVSTVEKVFMVRSNHDLALDQWLDSPFYKPDMDHQNAKTYFFLKYLILETIDQGEESLNAFKLAVENIEELPQLSNKVVYGDLDESYQIANVELGQHGHLGTGGARGSLQSFIKYRMPTVTGHTHSPERDGQNVVVGVTGSLEMGYNKGGSKWDRANCYVFSDGLTTLAPTYKIGEPQY